jgi:2,4-dienoyl-CoA reductase-like NADH-dependent reductase (Old Yellow Enzyme family)
MEKSTLFSPLTMRDVTFKNRVMLSPMAQYAALDGTITDWHWAHFSKFAMGGTGLICMEACKVERRGLGTVGDMGLWKDEQVPPLRELVSHLHGLGSKVGIQLNHAGRKAGNLRPWDGFGPLDRAAPVEGQEHWEVIGPSAVPYLDGWPMPREMTLADIQDVIAAFGSAARRADEAGMDVLEIHGAHGYLLHEFLSPAANVRTDQYGGSLENRMRFILEVTEAVRANWPAGKPLFFRVSAQDESGWSLDDSIVLARELKQRGVDAIDCSSGGINVRSMTASASSRKLGFQVPYAETIRRAADIATVAVGLIVDAQQAEDIVANGQADLVAIGREMLYDPFWTLHAARSLGADPDFSGIPQQYGWWLSRRAKTGYEDELRRLNEQRQETQGAAT